MEFVLSGIIGVLIGVTGSIIIFNRRRRTERAMYYSNNGAVARDIRETISVVMGVE